MGKRYFLAVPPEVYKNFISSKQKEEADISKFLGKEVRLTNTKYLNALVLKHTELRGIIPFDKKSLINLAKLKKGKYELK